MSAPTDTKPRATLSDYWAAERTFLAWVRTGLTLMGFGFVVARFGLFLQQLQIFRQAKITEAGVRRRAEFHYQQLDALQALRQQVRRDLLAESKKQCDEFAAPDSLDRSDPGGSADRPDSDPASLPHQAATLGLQRPGFEDFHQW